jgi:acetylornithine deacetylase/succinyl-diaminopimelate desuccinylase-like protein
MKTPKLTVVFLALLFTAAVPVWSQQGARLAEATSAIAQGDGSAGRRAAILRELEAAAIPYEQTEFEDARGRRGTNVAARLSIAGSPSKTLLLGAHYDRVAQGQGVVDNGASCAVILQLLAALKSRPLRSTEVKVVFFDLEEGGLSGSRAYFDSLRAAGQPLPNYAVNLDIFGYGDSFFAVASNPTGKLLAALLSTGTQGSFPLRLAVPGQYPASDHVSMMAAGIETLGIALIDGKEADGIMNLRAATSPPRILTLIHTPRDTMEAFRAEDVERGAAALERFIRLLDETP